MARLEGHVRCRHPSLLPIHHVGHTAEHLFYVMDLADDLSRPIGPAGAGLSPGDAGKPAGRGTAHSGRMGPSPDNCWNAGLSAPSGHDSS